MLRRVLLVLAAVVLPWLVVPWLVVRLLVEPDEDLARWDGFDGPLMEPDDAVGEAHDAVVARLSTAHARFARARTPLERLRWFRSWMEELGASADLDGTTIVPVDDGRVRGEWVLADGHDPDRRLLYVHGGGFQAGSPASHRPLTAELARRTGAAVFAVRYGLLPEHTRRSSIADVRAAWAWLVRTGPDGAATAAATAVAGDSAGANLALSLLLHLRDTGARRPDAAVVLAPPTDLTFSSPSWADNAATDPFLAPSYERFQALPRTVLLAGLWATSRIRPDDPAVSPLLGDLADLPPTLVQVSRDEMLRDDAVRWTNRARAAGSSVELQVWPRMVHVFQAFRELPESDVALGEVAAFLLRHGVGDVSRQHAAPTHPSGRRRSA